MTESTRKQQPALDRVFITRSLFVLSVILLAVMAVELASVLVLAFGAVIVAVLLRAIADPLCAKTPIPAPFCLAVAVLTVAGFVIAVAVFFGIEFTRQADELIMILPERVEALRAELQRTEIGRMISDMFLADPDNIDLSAGTPRFLASAFGGSVSLIVVLAGGFYLAANPSRYRDGFVELIPSHLQKRVRHSLNASGRALHGWLLAQLVSMTAVGLLTGIGLYFLGVPAAIALAIFAFVAQFVPIVGPFIAAVPGIAAASSLGTETALWAVGVYVVVQQLESNIITPWVQQHVVSLPMVLTMFSVVTFSALLGFLGMLFATPLAVVVFVLVRMLYVEDMLGHDIDVDVERETNGDA